MTQKVKLTKTVVEGLKPLPDRQLLVWDTTTRGFGVRVSPGGAKAYIIQRRVGTQTRRIKIGRTDETSPEVARQKAEKLAAQFAEGIDPVKKRKRDERLELTLRRASSNTSMRLSKRAAARAQKRSPEPCGTSRSTWPTSATGSRPRLPT